MKTGIVGLPQVGKTALFSMLTGVTPVAGRREDAVGVAKVPDDRLERLAELYHPRKLTHATLELVDVASLTEASLRDGTGIAELRGVDALIHVVRAFEDPSVPHAGGGIDPRRDIARLEFDLIVSDLGQVEKRRERVQKDLKKQRSAALADEAALLERMQAQLEAEKPLRTMALTAAEEKLTRGFQFLSQKPILYALNVGEDQAADLAGAVAAADLAAEPAPKTGVVAVCAKIEAEIAGLPGEEAAAFLASYGLQESGLTRLARAAYQLLGLISFFTAGEDECRAWTIAAGTRAVDAAAAIHTDLAKHFIRAEVIRWDELLALGGEAAAREKGKLRLEGKDYIVKDGDVMHIRHSG
ncbi:MAG TPA: redox-regulated ATPase YchF [Terriglobales bacterium]|nr:redox-regulated ATPase YchF [Terriglobales bacterium]